MLRFLPYDCWTLESPLDAPTLVAGMRERIEPTKWFRWPWSRDHTPLQGTIDERGFSASRIIHHRNAFLPVLYGKFTPTPSGTTIRIRMMPLPLVLVGWFGFLGVFGLIALPAAIQDGDWGFLPTIGVMAGVALLLMYGGFFAQAGKTKNLISDVLLEMHKEAMNRSEQSEDEEAT